MTDSGSRRGAANLAPILMIVSFAAMAGLLWWLGTTAEGTEPVVVEEETDVDSADAGIMVVTNDQLATQAASLVGQTVRVEEVPIATNVGENAFMIELGTPEQSNPFLVVLGSTLITEGRGIPEGTATVAGPILARTDSAVEAWVEAGVVPAGQRPIVEFASYFIEATRLEGPGLSSGDEDPGGDEEDGGGG